MHIHIPGREYSSCGNTPMIRFVRRSVGRQGVCRLVSVCHYFLKGREVIASMLLLLPEHSCFPLTERRLYLSVCMYNNTWALLGKGSRYAAPKKIYLLFFARRRRRELCQFFVSRERGGCSNNKGERERERLRWRQRERKIDR